METRHSNSAPAGRPIVEMMPYEGNRIDEEQIFLLGLDAQATEQSIAANAYCDIRGITERVPVRVISGDERKTLLAARRDFVDRFLRAVQGRPRDRDRRATLRQGHAVRAIPFRRRRWQISDRGAAMHAPAAEQGTVQPGLGQRDCLAERCSHRSGPGSRLRGARHLPGAFYLRPGEQGCAMPADPADAARVHGAGVASRGGKNHVESRGQIDSRGFART